MVAISKTPNWYRVTRGPNIRSGNGDHPLGRAGDCRKSFEGWGNCSRPPPDATALESNCSELFSAGLGAPIRTRGPAGYCRQDNEALPRTKLSVAGLVHDGHQLIGPGPAPLGIGRKGERCSAAL